MPKDILRVSGRAWIWTNAAALSLYTAQHHSETQRELWLGRKEYNWAIYPDTELEQLEPGASAWSLGPISLFLIPFFFLTPLVWSRYQTAPRGWGQLASVCQMEVGGSREGFRTPTGRWAPPAPQLLELSEITSLPCYTPLGEGKYHKRVIIYCFLNWLIKTRISP